MALEASIVERLQELRKWQIDQQERLLKQQQEQRELLSIEQERMYEALGLSIKDVIADESIIDRMSVSKIKEHVETLNDHETNQIIINDVSQDTPNISKQQINSLTKDSSTFGGLEEQSNMKLNVPDVCLKSFDTDSTPTDTSNYKNLPQYKLQFDTNNEAINETPKRFCRNNFEIREEGIAPLVPDKSLSKSILIDELPVPSPKKDFKTLLEEKLRDEGMNVNNSASMKNQIKRPFLRKGDGLARFQFNSNGNKVKKSVRQRNTTRTTNVSSNKSQQNINTKNAVEKPKVIIKNKKCSELTRRSIGTIANAVQQKLVLSNVALPKKFIRNSKSLPSSISSSISPQNVNKLIERCASNDESNQSDLDSSKLETKMFEMLEEKAENSSFCSTSSAVVAFMQQSTPLKLKNIRTNILSQSQMKNEAIDRSNGKILNEIVISKWDSGPFINDNVSQSSTKSTQQNLRKIMQPTNQKDQHIQYHKNESVEIIHPEIEDDAKNLSSCSDIDSQYENNCQDGLGDPSHNYNDMEEKTETNVSMHVRFAEYNEYKTIGLTDTSMLSTDSQSAAIYDKEKDWSDHSDSEESSDSEIFPLKKNVACQQHMTNDTSKLINPSLDQYDCIDPNYRVNNKALIKRESSENTEDSDSNSIEQSTDDEHSLFNDSEGTCYDEDTTISGIQEAMAKVLNDKDLEIETVPQDTMKSSTQSAASVTDQTIFKSDLLKNRLLELEREIEIFRKENAALSLQRQKIQDEHRKLQREFKEKQINLERERNQLTVSFQEEKKRLAREKSALENRLRDAREKSIQTKHERQEIQLLNEQLNELKDDMIEKESRWQAAQARQRSQIRVLQMENSKLKLEIERLKASKRVNGKLKPPSVISNTKAIHKINKQLDGKRADLQRRISMSDEELEPTKNTQKKIVDSTSSSSSTNHTSPSTIDTGKIIVYNSNTTHKPTVIKSSEETVSKKRHLYETLLKDATLDAHDCGHQKSPMIMDSKNDELIKLPVNYENKSDIDLRSKSTSTENEFTNEPLTNTIFQYPNKLSQSDGNSEQCDNAKINDIKKAQISQLNDKLQPHPLVRGSYEQFVCDIINPRNDGNQFINSNNSDSNYGNMGHKLPNVRNSYPQLNYSSDKTKLCTDQVQTFSPSASIDKQIEKKNLSAENECVQVEQKKRNYESDRMKIIHSSDSDLTPRKEPQNPLPRPSDNMTPHPENIQLSQISNLSTSRKPTSALPSSSSSSSSSPLINKNIREVKHPDGHTEYWYPNGNVKRIYPDRNITKMIYYNGDVRETTSDGCIKYFYAASKTWHTTYPDGFEMIEFPDGQQERRTKDGIVEVSFPDGSVRLMQPDGIEKWALPDGTIAETFPNGEKILSLPNGQREIHTADHKRREYPDGTVKFVYPDGTQETRYSNGRIRIKDKDGNLVMDSHQA